MKLSNNLKTALIAIVSTIATLIGVRAYYHYTNNEVLFNTAESKSASDSMVSFTNLPAGKPGDFTYAAEVSTPSVVHIKAVSKRNVSRVPSIIEQFFGYDDDFFGSPRQQNQESTGSGVIISADGYIVTNNHVVEGANSLEVITHNKRSYKAEIIGRDPSTDIAVIKIEDKNLPAITFGNSDNVKIGEWVLAVGNPFNLESTVTAGIVSAIGRNINILGRNRSQNPYNRGTQATINPIESFIQTDAAVNPGNSGGALVNLNGELIGINTAIASPNGSYAGYAFAVPAGIVKKVSADLIKHGDVQRAYIGISFEELNNKKAKEYDLKTENGIYVAQVPEGGAAHSSGVKKGDVITKADGIEIVNGAKFTELIGRKRPGDKVNLEINRNGAVKNISVTLKDSPDGNAPKKLATNTPFGKMGMELEELSSQELSRYGIKNGVRIKSIQNGGLLSQNTDFEPGFIITSIGGNRQVKTAKEVQQIINSAYENGEEGVLICGFYPDGGGRGCEGIPIR